MNIQVLGIEELFALVDLSGPPLLELLTPETRAWMASLGRRQSYSDGELVHARGDPDSTMEVVIDGAMRMVRIRHDGSQSFISTIGPGQHVADILMLATVARTHSAFAIGDTTIDHYDSAAFAQLIDNHEVLLALFRICGTRLGTALTMIDDLRTLSREAHLAKLLLAITQRSKTGYAVGVIQEDLASILGVSAMTVAKSLGLLKQEGLIETGYREIRVPDRNKLKQWLAGKEPD